MGVKRKIPPVFLLGAAGLAVAISASLLLASQPAETSQPLDIAALQAGSNGKMSPMVPSISSNGRNGQAERLSQSRHTAPAEHTGSHFDAEATKVAYATDLINDSGFDDETDYPTSYETFDLDEGDDRVVEDDRSDWNTHTLDQGERLTSLWQRDWDLPLATLYRLLDDDENASILNRIRPGQEIEWQVDEEGYLTHLRLWTDRASGYEWVREDDGWDFERGEVENGREVSHMVISAEIEGNISAALAERTDLSPRAAGAIAVLLDRYLPVRTHARSGDEFTLLLEMETLVGDDTPHNLRLLAFDYEGQRISVRAARNTNGRFYTPDGESLLPPFDRRPFSGNYRISSNFDPRRRHPVTGRVAPHSGTDFAMPIGTPVNAPADGRVTRVENHPYAGRFIVIEHGQGYSTRYLHLHRQLVSVGDTVKRGDRIALSGNTGRSTGPHLHYEIHVNNQPRDPMRVELPESESLAGEELEKFKSLSQTLLAQLDNSERNTQVAFTPYDELLSQ
ncbi:Peptidase M23 [Thioalkalivibrio sp. K90mix]|jgi:murein DD-endopeptidase|uniref:peptidoglycan DD-metalloendopeptidase family protein n=1 Tax=Thioalkalivibrio sp. (strain K90mix) TaxID=396595 RepID=UPI000195A555|nr:Peptidase M23 [Thioalkalivibrio sp. K90mix]